MSTPTIVQFEDPTPRVPRGAKGRQTFANTLRGRPGEWALLGQFSNPGTARTTAYDIRNAKNPQDQPFAPAGSFEAATHTMFGEHRVYVRFVGGERR